MKGWRDGAVGRRDGGTAGEAGEGGAPPPPPPPAHRKGLAVAALPARPVQVRVLELGRRVALRRP